MREVLDPPACGLTCLSLLLLARASSLSSAQQPASHGRLFPPSDLGLLEAPDRDLWQPPDQIMDAMGIADGSVVADIGAGAGWFTIRLARRVGPQGLVYAEDVQDEMINAITRRVQREGLTNVKPVLGIGSNPRLPARSLDAVLVVDAYHEIAGPRHDAHEPRARAQAAGPHRRRRLQAGRHRPRAGAGRTRQPRRRREGRERGRPPADPRRSPSCRISNF